MSAQQIAQQHENWKRIAQTCAKATQICAETTSEKTFFFQREKSKTQLRNKKGDKKYKKRAESSLIFLCGKTMHKIAIQNAKNVQQVANGKQMSQTDAKATQICAQNASAKMFCFLQKKNKNSETQ